MARRWIKIWVEEWESGSVRVDMNSAERGCWLDMILKASHSRIEGSICRGESLGYSVEDLAHDFQIPVDIVQSTINKRLKDGSITMSDNGIITIVNWNKYQAEMKQRDKKNGNLPIENELSFKKWLAGKVKQYPDVAENTLRQMYEDELGKEQHEQLDKEIRDNS